MRAFVNDFKANSASKRDEVSNAGSAADDPGEKAGRFKLTIGSKSEIILPLELLNRLELASGDEMNGFVQGQEVHLSKAPKKTDSFSPSVLKMLAERLRSADVLPVAQTIIQTLLNQGGMF